MENMLRTAILTGGLVLGGLVAYKAAVQSVRGTTESKNPAEILERAKKVHESGRKINWKDIVAALCGDG